MYVLICPHPIEIPFGQNIELEGVWLWNYPEPTAGRKVVQSREDCRQHGLNASSAAPQACDDPLRFICGLRRGVNAAAQVGYARLQAGAGRAYRRNAFACEARSVVVASSGAWSLLRRCAATLHLRTALGAARLWAAPPATGPHPLRDARHRHTVVEKFLRGHEGPLCVACSWGYRSRAGVCVPCEMADAGARWPPGR